MVAFPPGISNMYYLVVLAKMVSIEKLEDATIKRNKAFFLVMSHKRLITVSSSTSIITILFSRLLYQNG